MNNEEAGNVRHQRCVPFLSDFIETTQYYQFVELCASCQQYRYMGLCYGDAGVGKTFSARYYTQWDQTERWLAGALEHQVRTEQLRMAFYTPDVLMSAKRFEQELLHLHVQMKMLEHLSPPASQPQAFCQYPRRGYVVTPLEWDLLVIDEADRLKSVQLEVLRDLFDRSQMGVVLIGMAGLERRLTRYPQFYSRVGFKHEYCALQPKDLREVFNQQWSQRHPAEEGDLLVSEILDEDALSAIIRMTEGNFRDVVRLLQQVERILLLNQLSKVTKAVVETARMNLLVGPERKP
jgi:DNA transposition AAA+ family ATPase